MYLNKIRSGIAAVSALTLLAGCRMDVSSGFSVTELYGLSTQLNNSGPFSQSTTTVSFEVASYEDCAARVKLLEPLKKNQFEFGIAPGERPDKSISCGVSFSPDLATKAGARINTSEKETYGTDTHHYEYYSAGDNLVAVDMVLNLPRIKERSDMIAKVPVLPKPSAVGGSPVTLSVDLRNDTTEPARFCLAAPQSSVGISARDVLLTIPPGGLYTYTFSPDSTLALMKSGRAKLFSFVTDLKPAKGAGRGEASVRPCDRDVQL